MPLIKSKSPRAFKDNVKAEMDSGKPEKQSLAIAYSVKRQNAKKKMAFGGMAEEDNAVSPMPRKPDDKRLDEKEYMADQFKDGGEIGPEDFMSDDERAGSIAEAIMQKRSRKKMADGGMVDREENTEESPPDLDSLNIEAAGKELYDDSQISPQPEDSNEKGDMIDSDQHDMISQIRAKIKAKRGM